MADNNTPPPIVPGEPLPRQALLSRLGDSGLRAYGGFVSEEFIRKLQGSAARRVYNEMASNDATCAAVLEVVTSLVCGLDWSVTPAREDQAGLEAKQFVEGVLFKDMRAAGDTAAFADVLAEACTMFTYGFAPLEIVWKIRGGRNGDPRLHSEFDDGKWGIGSMELRGQNALSRWHFDDGVLTGFWHMPTMRPGTQVYIPLEKTALFRTTSIKGNPEGQSILRRAYRSWFFKSKIEDLEAMGVERDLAGFPIARIPARYMDSPNNDPNDRLIGQMWQRLVTQTRRDQQEGIVIPSDTYVNADGTPTGQRLFDFELLSSGGARQHNTSAIIDRYDRKIATAMLADFIFLGQGAVGSFALSSDKTALFSKALIAYVKRMAAVFNGVITKLWELNALDPALRPTLSHGDLETRDLNELAAFLTAMAGAGAMLFPDEALENHLRNEAGLPKRSEEGAGGIGKMRDYGAPTMLDYEDDDETWELGR